MIKVASPRQSISPRKGEKVVMVLGENGFQTGEGRGEYLDLNLPGVQQELLEAIFNVNKNIILVLNNNNSLSIKRQPATYCSH